MVDLDLFFRYLKGRCHGNQFCEKMANSPHLLLWHSEKNGISSLAQCAHFGPVTPELTELICELLVRHVKNGVFSRISPAILDRFSQSFHRMKMLWVQMIDLDLVFRFVKERCHGNQNNVGRSNKRGLILSAVFALAFENELECHYLYVCINGSDDHRLHLNCCRSCTAATSQPSHTLPLSV